MNPTPQKGLTTTVYQRPLTSHLCLLTSAFSLLTGSSTFDHSSSDSIETAPFWAAQQLKSGDAFFTPNIFASFRSAILDHLVLRRFELRKSALLRSVPARS